MTALLDLLPALASRIARLPLGDWPTPVERFERASTPDLRLPSELWLKRDDQSSAVYGGSKLRLLEHLLADAQQRGARVVYSTGAAGSNFALATALHASRVGLEPAAISFPQPSTPELEQSHAALRRHARVMEIAHWALLPLASARAEREAAENGRFAVVLSQVRFDRSALFGYVAAGVELAQQVASGACPAPTRIVLPIGSAATTAGILAGLSLSRRLGLWQAAPATIDAVRIAAWPLSRKSRVLGLALSTLEALSGLTGDARLRLDRSALFPVQLVTDQLGPGYPHPTPLGQRARRAFAAAGYPILDDTYSAKAAAHLSSPGVLEQAGPVLFWCTKSSAPLPTNTAASQK